MHIGGGIERSGDFLQDAQGHQSSNTSSANLSGDFHRIRVLTFQNNCYLSFFFFFFNFLKTCLTVLMFFRLKAPMYHGIRVGKNLAVSYNMHCFQVRENPTAQDKTINLGLRLGGFLSDAGWYSESEEVLSACKELCIANNQTPEDWCRTLDCCHK